MKRTLTVAVSVGLAALTACTSNPGPASPDASSTSAPAQSASASTSQVPPSESSADATAASGVKGACDLFNTLHTQYKAVPGNDSAGFEAIYLKAQAAKDTASEDLSGLFAALSVLALDHSGAAETSGQPDQASKDAVRDAVFANAGTCTAEGVTLRL